MTDHVDAWGEMVLNGVHYPLSDPLQMSNLSVFQGRVVFGDPGKDDNPLLSSLVMSDFSGGHGVTELNEGIDLQRFAHGTLYARFPGQITKPLYASNNAAGGAQGGTGDKRVLGQMWDEAGQRYLIVYTDGLNVRRGLIGTTTDNTLNAAYAGAAAGTLTGGLPTNKGVAFQGTGADERFFIPQTNGYSTITATSAAVTDVPSPDMVSFAVWDNKLIGLDRTGVIWSNLSGDSGVAWTAYPTTVQLPRSRRVRNIINFFDRRDAPCLFIITDQDIWQFDPDVPDIWRIDFGFPAHPDHGLAAAVWNGQLFISVGMAVMRYTGGSFQPVGLDRDDGLPAVWQGRIVDLVPGYNGLYALVQATNKDTRLGGRSTVHEFSGSGWQCVWADHPSPPQLLRDALTVTGLSLTSSGDKQTLVLTTGGEDNHLYTLPLGLTFANPRASIATGQLFSPGLEHYLETGEFDANLTGYTKIANALQFSIEEPVAIPANDRDILNIYTRIDRGAWTPLGGMVAVPGRYAYSFGPTLSPNVGTAGASFDKIAFRFVVTRNEVYNADKPIILTNAVFSYLKLVNGSKAWTATVPLQYAHQGVGPNELMDAAEALLTTPAFVTMTYGGEDFRVRLTQMAGGRWGGDDERGQMRLSLLEIKSTLSPDTV